MLSEEAGLNTKHSSASSKSDVPLLREIIIQQFFANGTASNVIRFVNPKIDQFDLDNLDHEDGAQGNIITTSFSYDHLIFERVSSSRHIWTAQDLVGAKTDIHSGGSRASLSGIKLRELSNVTAMDSGGFGSIGGVMSGSSEFGILTSVGLDKYASKYVNRTLSNLSGRIMQRTKLDGIAGQILNPIIGKAVGSVMNPVNQVLGGVGKTIDNAVGGVFKTIDRSIGGAVGEVTGGISKAIERGLGGVLDSVTPSIKDASDAVSGAVGAIGKGIESMGKDAGSALGGIGTGFISKEDGIRLGQISNPEDLAKVKEALFGESDAFTPIMDRVEFDNDLRGFTDR